MMKDPLINTHAPDFELEGLHGPVRLKDHRGRKVLIALLRNAKCAVCNLWVHQTASHARAWSAGGLDVIAVFESSGEKLRVQFEGRDVPFPVAADPDGSVHVTFGSENDPGRIATLVASGSAEHALEAAAKAGFAPTMEPGANFNRIPSEVLVSEDGLIALVHHADEVTNHLSVSAIEGWMGSR